MKYFSFPDCLSDSSFLKWSVHVAEARIRKTEVALAMIPYVLMWLSFNEHFFKVDTLIF